MQEEKFSEYHFNPETRPILVNTQNNDFYRWEGGDSYTNLRTLGSGEIKPELAKKIFVISYTATRMSDINPNFALAINKLKLKIIP